MKKLAFLAILAVALVLSVATLSASCSLPYKWVGDYGYGSFESNGERIYFMAESSSGEPITYSGGATMMRQRIACVSCHGTGGRGGRVAMMMWRFDAPGITWDNLTQEEPHKEELGQEEHEEHPPYTEETLKSAITRLIPSVAVTS